MAGNYVFRHCSLWDRDNFFIHIKMLKSQQQQKKKSVGETNLNCERTSALCVKKKLNTLACEGIPNTHL